MSTEPLPLLPDAESVESAKKASNALQVVGWFSVGLAVAVASIYLGAELRSRYLFKRRTPYDFYSHVGEQSSGEFGMGI
jgi:hypothetical protein